MKEVGKLVVSLDFELMWGVRDLVTVNTYGQHINGVHTALPQILQHFEQYGIKGTFAAVGFLFFKDKQELLQGLPEVMPQYADTNLSPYGSYLHETVGAHAGEDPYHYGDHLIELIKNTPGQEIGTHTFSHYYCLEPGQDLEAFRHDLQAALAIAQRRGINLSSIIFPRNQVNEAYLQVCETMGLITYRSNEESWIYKARNWNDETLLRRAFRLLDAYVNISGHHCYTEQYMHSDNMVNIPASRFLRPYSKKLKGLENLRLKRIKDSMTHAAKNKLTYHLWWHPHNFGINQEENFAFLTQILQHYQELKARYNFTSITMSELAKEIKATKSLQ